MKKNKKIICSCYLFLLVLLPLCAWGEIYEVPASISTVDGNNFCGGAVCTSKDTIIIKAGSRGGILFKNFDGNGNYITITNETATPSSPVNITNDGKGGMGVLSLQNCKYVDLRGDNDPSLIASERSKGIIVNLTSGPTPKAGGIWIYGESNNIKVGYIEVNALNNTSTTGGGVKMADTNLDGGHAYSDIELHHLWLHDLRIQGMYLGRNDPFGQQASEFGGKTRPTLRRISIHDNIIENAGLEGVDLKGCDAGPNEFYNNKIYRSGAQATKAGAWPKYENSGGFTAGIKVSWTTHGARVNIYDNYFESTAGPSVYIVGSYTHSDLKNIDGGIGGKIYIHDNTIVDPATQYGPLTIPAVLEGQSFPFYQAGIVSRYRTFHCEAYDNKIVQPNGYGLAVSGSEGSVLKASRNLITASKLTYGIGGEVYEGKNTVYTEGTGTDSNVYPFANDKSMERGPSPPIGVAVKAYN